MAQRRMLSKRISLSKKVNKLNLKSQIIYTWTIPYLDDFGCYPADPEDIKDEIFPKNKKIGIIDIKNALLEEKKIGLIYLYKIGDNYYQQYIKFADFQTFRKDRPQKKTYPCFDKKFEANDIP